MWMDGQMDMMKLIAASAYLKTLARAR